MITIEMGRRILWARDTAPAPSLGWGVPAHMSYATAIDEPKAALHVLISTLTGQKVNITKVIIHNVNSTPCTLYHFRYLSAIMSLILGKRSAGVQKQLLTHQ